MPDLFSAECPVCKSEIDPIDFPLRPGHSVVYECFYCGAELLLWSDGTVIKRAEAQDEHE